MLKLQNSNSIYTLQFFRLCFSSFLFFVSFAMIIPELPAYLTSLGGEDYKGLIISLFTLTAGLSRPFSGKLADRIGRKPVLFLGVLMSFTCGLMYPFLATVSGFLLLRFLHGFSTGFTPTGTSAYVADLVPADKRGEAMGLLGLTSNIGTAIGPAVGSEIATAYSLDAMFYCGAAFGLLSMLVLLGLPETIAQPERFKWNLLYIRRHEIIEPKVLKASSVMFLSIFALGAILTVIPDFSEYVGLRNKGIFFTYYTLSSLLVRILAGRASDRYGRIIVLKVAMLMYFSALLFISFAHSANALLFGAVLYGLAAGMSAPTIFALTIDLSDDRFRGRALATLYIALEAGIGLGALVAGWVFANQYDNLPKVFWLSAALAFGALLVLQFGKMKEK